MQGIFTSPSDYLSHWTLVVYDTDDGSWKHFNSAGNRNVDRGGHYDEAIALVSFVKLCVNEIVDVANRQ
ncbi:hypothetical protein HYC85_022223 [Camellia sinensis]|uniref:Ubiquitin-like protease family profile domain-containing protein n=1 Tax=Camellia sinensis TaxID=4442 RepID=A0A7J7GNN4_CAMSI|nr:hypothetical protein HYC85_022223 [Camellia sinensis]